MYVEYQVSLRIQFEWKAQAEIKLFGMALDERSQVSREFFNKNIIHLRRNMPRLKDFKGYDLKESQASKVGLEARKIQIGGCALSVVEATYQALDRIPKGKGTKRAFVTASG